MKQVVLMTVMGALLGVRAATSTPEGWTDDYEAALKRAADEKKNILVDFTGSDWCGWCMRLDQEVLSTDLFRKEAPKRFVLLFIDTPQDKSLLSKVGRKQNRTLVKKYAVDGFPTLLVLDPTGKEVARLGYREGGPKAFLKYVDDAVREAPDVAKYIKPIEAVLNASDAAMQREMEEQSKKVMARFAAESKKPESAKQKKKRQKEMDRAMRESFFEIVLPKYIPLYEKAFAEARAMTVPANMEERKKELIGQQEEEFKMMKTAYEDYRKKGDSGADDDGD